VAELAAHVTSLETASTPAPARQLNRRRAPCQPPKKLGSLASVDDMRRSVWSAFTGGGRASTSGKPAVSGAWNQVLSCGIAGTLDAQRPVTDFDQLYVQAVAMHPLLIRKVQAWAEASDGYFQLDVRNRSHTALGMGSSLKRRFSQLGMSFRTKAALPVPEARFVRWNHVRDDENPEESIRWCGLKSPGRALEKMTRSYAQDCSFLVDLCRQSIYFARVADLASCLRAVAADPEVSLVRVKNRLDPRHDARLSGGFRNVSLNLRVDSEASREVGAETHVCEVQLVLTAMARIKNDEGHRKYIAFRNLRGE